MPQSLHFSCLVLRILVRSNFLYTFRESNSYIYTDIPSFESHVVRVATAGVNPLLSGTMGEAAHLSHAERVKLIQSARKALDNAGFLDTPIIAGTGAASTRESVELANEAAAAGADYAIVLTVGVFAGALTKPSLKAHFIEVAQKSPIPLIIYNCEFLNISENTNS